MIGPFFCNNNNNNNKAPFLCAVVQSRCVPFDFDDGLKTPLKVFVLLFLDNVVVSIRHKNDTILHHIFDSRNHHHRALQNIIESSSSSLLLFEY